MRNFLIFWVIFLLTGCADKKIAKDFDKNINDFNDFYHSNKENLENQVLVFSQTEKEEIRDCKKADILADNIDLKALVKLLSNLYNTNINYSSDINMDSKIAPEAPKTQPDDQKKPEPAPQINNKISLNMNDVCLEDVFDNLTETYNIGVEHFPYGYIIYPKQLKTETFVVDYHNFYRKGKSSTAIVNSQLKTQDSQDHQSYSSVSSESNETFWNSIAKTIRSILSTDKERKLLPPTGTETDQPLEDFYVYKESGLVVVTAYPKQLSYIRNFISKINNDSTRQVLIEAKILEVELKEEFNNGIQWDLLKKNLTYSSFGAANAVFPKIAGIHNTQSLAAGNDLQSSVLSGKLNNKNNFNIVMQALASQGKISVMSSPRILVLNNQRALIKSGEEKYFVTNVKNLTLANNNTTNVTAQSGFDLEPFFSGLALDTTARIINNKELLLHIHPMISRVNDEEKLITIDDKNTKIPVAKIQSREADTVVKALSGDIIILGGMTQNLVQLDETGLPINKGSAAFNKILNLFSAKTHSSNKVELIILLKPTIVDINNLNSREDIGTFKM